MKLVPLSQGEFAEVDDADYEVLSVWKWTLLKTSGLKYAYRAVKKNGKQKNILMHRQIMQPEHNIKIDHIDGNGLNNKRSNLRKAPKGANNCNAIGQKGKTSKYKGVSWHKSSGKWRAVISDYKRARHIMHSDCELTCAMAYDREAKKSFGEFALLNFPESGRSSIRE